MKVYYFGCWGRVGHFLYLPSGQWVPGNTSDLEIAAYDSAGDPARKRRGGGWDCKDQPEHQWRLTHRAGWTFFGCFDRSVDGRTGSVAVLVAEGAHDEPAMRAMFAEHFPSVWARLEQAKKSRGES